MTLNIIKALQISVVVSFLVSLSSNVAASNPPDFDQLSRQVAARQLPSEKSKKASKELRQLHAEFVAFKKAGGKSFAPSNRNLRLANQRVLFEAITVADGPDGKRALSALGGTRLDSINYLVSGWLPISAISHLESIPFLRSVRASHIETQAGLVTSQGDVATRASNARSLYGLDGSGVTVGTMSDSFDCLGQAATDVANDDLPTGIGYVEISSCAGAIDEGRAMMQIIHDLAPGTTQLFHTAYEGPIAFANGIRSLANAGADIIVDDIIYFGEPFFQDGPIAQAVDEVTLQQGVVYFSAAGNYGNQSYESAFRPDSTDNRWHDFDPTEAEDIFQSIYIPSGETVNIILQWTEPYASVSGPPGASTDFDLYISDSPYTQFLASSTDPNIGSDPIEILTFTNSGAGAFFNILIYRYAGNATPTLKYIYFGSMDVNEFATNSSTLFGHANAEWAGATGSVNYWQTPTYGVSPPVKASSSAKGGTPILFDTIGNPIAPLFRSKPNISCVHGGNTTFFGQDVEPDGWPNFFGTSAAAPHAAALAALIKEYKQALNPLQIFEVLEQSAVDMEAPGFDFLTGAGLCDVTSALGELEVPDITLSVTPTPMTLPEPGGNVSFGVTVNNVGDIDVALTALTDDAIGDISGQGNCLVPQNLQAPGGSYSCSYTLVGSGNAGDVLPLTVAATANGPQNSDTENYQTSVTITDVLPTANLTATADPSSLPEPGGDITILVVIQNTGTAEPIDVTSLADSLAGDLNGKGSCSYPVSIQPLSTYQCSYMASISGKAGDTVTLQVNTIVQDDELNSLNVNDVAAVSITEVIPENTCNLNMVSERIDSSEVQHEACQTLILGPSYLAEQGASVTASGGESVSLVPEFLIENGAILEIKTCGQSLCQVSEAPMPYGCHSCVDLICAADSGCCSLVFDQACVDKVDSICGLVCE